jgi:hypothetical protein
MLNFHLFLSFANSVGSFSFAYTFCVDQAGRVLHHLPISEFFGAGRIVELRQAAKFAPWEIAAETGA